MGCVCLEGWGVERSETEEKRGGEREGSGVWLGLGFTCHFKRPERKNLRNHKSHEKSDYMVRCALKNDDGGKSNSEQ